MRYALGPRIRLHANNAVEVVTNRHLRRRATLRRYAFDAARTVTNGVLVDHADYKFLVRTQDKTIGRQTFSDGAFDLGVMEDALRLLEAEVGSHVIRGCTLVDVGANIGTTAIPAAVTWGAERVIAIEPSPVNFDLLRCNVILNGMDDRIVCINSAITTDPGTIELELSDDNSGDHRVRLTDAVGELEEQHRSTVAVRGEPLDTVMDRTGTNGDDLGLVWVDTQGHEGQVLGSATRTIETGVPFIIEYWPYALQRAEGLDVLHSIVESRFSAIIDVRDQRRMPARDVASLAETYSGLLGYTDLALIP